MLASCSKELTEEVAPVFDKSTIFATYEADQGSTRSVATPNQKDGYDFTWENGDAIGVFNAVSKDAANAHFGYTNIVDGVAEFQGDLDFLEDGEYVGYYPYEKDRELSVVNNLDVITLNIPATQNYRFSSTHAKYDKTAGSFAANVNPAVAYGKNNEGKLEMKFLPVASYLRVPIKGSGTVKNLELTIKNEGNAEQTIAGAFTATVASIKTAETSKDVKINSITDNSGKTITLNCGKGVELNPEIATNFWFVIPAGIQAYTFEITVNGSAKVEDKLTYSLKNELVVAVNTPYTLSGANFTWIEGNKCAITDEFSFMLYQYAANNVDDLTDEVDAVLGLKNGAKIKDALIFKPLDYTQKTTFDQALCLPYGDALNFVKAAIDNYNKEGFKPLKGVVSSAVKDENGKPAAATIKGLKVTGNGLLSVKTFTNIAFEGATVTTTATTPAYFLATVPTAKTDYPGVTLKDCVLKAPEGVTTAAVFNTVAANAVTDEMYEAFGGLVNGVKFNGQAVAYANTLQAGKNDYSAKPVSKNFIAGATETTDEVNLFNAISANDKGGIVAVADAAAAKVFTENVTASKVGNYCSVVTVDVVAATGTATPQYKVNKSYWTGLIADSMKDDGVFTAEELAYIVKNNNYPANATPSAIPLTNDIDLMGDVTVGANGLVTSATGKNWAEVLEQVVMGTNSNRTLRIDGTKDDAKSNYTISNIRIAPKAESEAPFVSLFGYDAAVANLNVNKLYINVKAMETPVPVSGLAITTYKGNDIIKNVKVTNADIIAHDKEVVGGIVKTLKGNEYSAQLDNVEFVGRITSYAVGETPVRGALAGELLLGDDSLTFDKLKATLKAENGDTDYMDVFGQVVVSTTKQPNSKFDVELTFTNFGCEAPEKFEAAATLANDVVVRLNTYAKTVNDGGSTKDIPVKKYVAPKTN